MKNEITIDGMIVAVDGDNVTLHLQGTQYTVPANVCSILLMAVANSYQYGFMDGMDEVDKIRNEVMK